MAAPAYRSVGTPVYDSGASVTPAPGTIAANDILILVVATYGADAISVDNSYTELYDTNYVHVYWKRTTGTEGTTTVSGASNSISACIYAFSGAITSGSPLGGETPVANTSSGTSITNGSFSTTAAEELVLMAFGITDNNNVSGVSYGSLDGGTGYDSGGTNAGNDSRQGLAWGYKTSAGSVGTITATQASTDAWTSYIFTLKPAPPAQTATPASLTNTHAYGTPSVVKGAVTRTPTGLTVVHSFGTPQVNKAGSLTIEHAYEMLDLGLAGSAIEARVFHRASLYLNPADFDFAVYTFEIVAINVHATQDYDVYLVDCSDSDTVLATINVPANLTDATRYRSSVFVPAPGNHQLAPKIELNLVGNDIRIYAARIIITQTGAARTRLQYPLVGQLANTVNVSDTNTAYLWQTNTATYGTNGAAWRDRFYKGTVDEDYDGLRGTTPWTFEATLASEDSNQVHAALVPGDGAGTAVTGTELSTSGTDWALLSADFANDASGFADATEFTANIRCAGDPWPYAYLGAARLYVRLEDPTLLEVHRRLTRAVAAQTTAVYSPYGRFKMETSKFGGSPTYWAEAVGDCLDATDAIEPAEVNSPSGGGGTVIDGFGIAFNSATVARVRGDTGGTPTDGYDIYWRCPDVTNAVTTQGARIVIKYSGSADQTPTPSSLTNTHSYGTPSVEKGSVDRSPSSFTNTQSYGSATVAQVAAPASFENLHTYGSAVPVYNQTISAVGFDVDPNLQRFGFVTDITVGQYLYHRRWVNNYANDAEMWVFGVEGYDVWADIISEYEDYGYDLVTETMRVGHDGTGVETGFKSSHQGFVTLWNGGSTYDTSAYWLIGVRYELWNLGTGVGEPETIYVSSQAYGKSLGVADYVDAATLAASEFYASVVVDPEVAGWVTFYQALPTYLTSPDTVHLSTAAQRDTGNVPGRLIVRFVQYPSSTAKTLPEDRYPHAWMVYDLYEPQTATPVAFENAQSFGTAAAVEVAYPSALTNTHSFGTATRTPGPITAYMTALRTRALIANAMVQPGAQGTFAEWTDVQNGNAMLAVTSEPGVSLPSGVSACLDVYGDTEHWFGSYFLPCERGTLYWEFSYHSPQLHDAQVLLYFWQNNGWPAAEPNSFILLSQTGVAATSGFTRVSGSVTAPADTMFAMVLFQFGSSSASHHMYFTKLHLGPGESYVDGDAAGYLFEPHDLGDHGATVLYPTGVPTVAKGTVDRSPSSLTNTHSYGSVSVTKAYTAAPSSLTNLHTYGTPSVTKGTVTRTPTGLTVSHDFGSPSTASGMVLSNVGGLENTHTYGTAKYNLQRLVSALTNTHSYGGVTVSKTYTVTPASLTNTHTYGTVSIARSVPVSALTNTHTYGTASVAKTYTAAPSALTNTHTYGAVTIHRTIPVSGLTNTHSYGTASAGTDTVFRYPDSYVDVPAFGTPSVQLALSVAPAAFANAQSFGVPGSVLGGVTRTPSSLTNTHAYGTPSVGMGNDAYPSAFENSHAYGAPAVEKGSVDRAPSALTVTHSYGTATRSAAYTASPASYANAQSLGVPSVVKGGVTRTCTALTNTHTYGSPSLAVGYQLSNVGGFDNLHSYGSVQVSLGGISRAPASYSDAPQFGVATRLVTYTASPASLTNTHSYGAASASPGAVTRSPASLSNSQLFGTPSVSVGNNAYPSSLENLHTYGTATRTPGAVTRTPGSYSDAPQFGTATRLVTYTAAPASLTNTHTFGTASVTAAITASPSALENAHTYGTAEAQIEGTAQDRYPDSFSVAHTFGTASVLYDQSRTPSGLENTHTYGTVVWHLTIPVAALTVVHLYGDPEVYVPRLPSIPKKRNVPTRVVSPVRRSSNEGRIAEEELLPFLSTTPANLIEDAEFTTGILSDENLTGLWDSNQVAYGSGFKSLNVPSVVSPESVPAGHPGFDAYYKIEFEHTYDPAGGSNYTTPLDDIRRRATQLHVDPYLEHFFDEAEWDCGLDPEFTEDESLAHFYVVGYDTTADQHSMYAHVHSFPTAHPDGITTGMRQTGTGAQGQPTLYPFPTLGDWDSWFVGMTPGKYYALHFDLLGATNDAGWVNAYIYYLNAQGQTVGTVSPRQWNSSTTWQTCTIATAGAPCPPTAVEMLIMLGFSNGSGKQQYITNFRFTERAYSGMERYDWVVVPHETDDPWTRGIEVTVPSSSGNTWWGPPIDIGYWVDNWPHQYANFYGTYQISCLTEGIPGAWYVSNSIRYLDENYVVLATRSGASRLINQNYNCYAPSSLYQRANIPTGTRYVQVSIILPSRTPVETYYIYWYGVSINTYGGGTTLWFNGQDESIGVVSQNLFAGPYMRYEGPWQDGAQYPSLGSDRCPDRNPAWLAYCAADERWYPMIRMWVYRESTYERIVSDPDHVHPWFATVPYMAFDTLPYGGVFRYDATDEDFIDDTPIPYNEWFEIVIHPTPVADPDDYSWWSWEAQWDMNKDHIDLNHGGPTGDLAHLRCYRNFTLELEALGAPGDVFYCSPWLVDPSGTMTEWKNGDSEQWGWRPHTWANWYSDPRFVGGTARVVVDERHFEAIPFDRETTVEVVTSIPGYDLPEGADRALHIHVAASATNSQASFVSFEEILDWPYAADDVWPWGWGSLSAEVLYLGPDEARGVFGLAQRQRQSGGFWQSGWVWMPESGVWERQELDTAHTDPNRDVQEYGVMAFSAVVPAVDIYVALPRLVFDWDSEVDGTAPYVDGDSPYYAWESTPHASRTVLAEGTEPEFSYQDAVTRIRKVGSQVRRVVSRVKRR